MDAGEKASEFKAKGYLALGLTYSLQATDGEWTVVVKGPLLLGLQSGLNVILRAPVLLST